MVKSTVADWDVTPVNNTDVGGINIAEGTSVPSDMNNALREMMAQIASTANLAGLTDKVAARANLGADGNIHKRTVITSSTTFNFDASTKRALIEVVGGGGAAGGAANSAGASGAAATSGGGAGGYCAKLIDNPVSASVVIGAGGVSTAGGAGGDGGQSSWSDGTNSLIASGGKGTGNNTGGITVSTRFGGAGGGATGGDLNVTGDRGENAFSLGLGAITGGSFAIVCGKGASSRYGSGGYGANYAAGGGSYLNGGKSSDYGSGGGGGASWGGGGAVAGGNGTPGVVIVTEYK